MTGAQPGVRNSNWKGGRTTDPRGYVLVKMPEHPNADARGYVYEHRLVAEAHLGRYLLPGEEVHHHDENKSNNDWANLIVTQSRAEHAVHHRKRTDLRMPEEENPMVLCECGCESTFHLYDDQGRPRRFISGHNTRSRNYG